MNFVELTEKTGKRPGLFNVSTIQCVLPKKGEGCAILVQGEWIGVTEEYKIVKERMNNLKDITMIEIL